MKTAVSQFLNFALLLFASSVTLVKRSTIANLSFQSISNSLEKIDQSEAEVTETFAPSLRDPAFSFHPYKLVFTSFTLSNFDAHSSLNELYLAHAPPLLA